ncbi:hypothetical protein EVAR_26781_1 [Eumeta japonica]|uniref:RNase H type-1 domain-containing protein n=1 Tax=Eumeta variegata TaxID=151549 RepID=A0A4C1XD51_EUMVA|nr:hypothetical protein EVAR_26781_1 [Eumeta japonica]
MVLMEWRDGDGCGSQSYDSIPSRQCFGWLQRAIRKIKNGNNGLVNIFSDSRSSLEILICSKTYLSLAHEARRDLFEVVARGRAVRLFWVRAHVGIAENERTDTCFPHTVQSSPDGATLTKKKAADYDRFPLSHAKNVIKAASLEECQKQYAEGSTGEITKCFFSRMEGKR